MRLGHVIQYSDHVFSVFITRRGLSVDIIFFSVDDEKLLSLYEYDQDIYQIKLSN